MRIEHFRYAFKRLNGFYLKEHIILFRKPLELWNELTGESITFKTLDEVLAYELDGETVRDIIERTETLYLPPLNGGEAQEMARKSLSSSVMQVTAQATEQTSSCCLQKLM